jgi:hypothetical protein
VYSAKYEPEIGTQNQKVSLTKVRRTDGMCTYMYVQWFTEQRVGLKQVNNMYNLSQTHDNLQP